LVHVTYFSAPSRWSAEKRARHMEYVKALEAVGVDPVLSKFDQVAKFCRDEDKYCPFFEEKQTDVGLAVSVLSDAYDGKIQRAIIVTADSDHRPLFLKLRARFPEIRLSLVAPPGRLRFASELRKLATDCDELTEGRLNSCRFPRNVINGRGAVIARGHSSYAHPDWRV
jgi:hypothetical protein